MDLPELRRLSAGGDLTQTSTPPLPPPPPAAAFGMDAFGFHQDMDVSQGRWPRQEALILLEIRTRLDSKFREASSHKAPLWDEISRIMSEEHGYQRSGKKCREKLENLYKYYKKTKDGKAGKQDGKHYRFLRQLDALYGDKTNTNTNSTTSNNQSFHATHESFQDHRPYHNLSLSSSSTEFDDSSDSDTDQHKRERKGWKMKLGEYVEVQLKRFMEAQEAWMDEMLRNLEHTERESMRREDAWRKQEEARWDKEHRFWVGEKAWIEARDAALVEGLDRISSRRVKKASSVLPELQVDMDKVEEGEPPRTGIWEDISGEISCLECNHGVKRCRQTLKDN